MKNNFLKSVVLAGGLSVMMGSANAQVPVLGALPVPGLDALQGLDLVGVIPLGSLPVLGSLGGGLPSLEGLPILGSLGGGLPGLGSLPILGSLGDGGLPIPGLDGLPLDLGANFLEQLTKTVDDAADDLAGSSGVSDQLTDVVDALPSADFDLIQAEATAIADELIVLIEHLQANLMGLGVAGLPIPGLDVLPGLDSLPGLSVLPRLDFLPLPL